MALVLTPDDVVVFAGDSITDCGRGWGLGPSPTGPLGDGWVKLTVDLMAARYPGSSPRWHNEGRSGHTSRDLLALWDETVLAKDPTWATLLVGVNDCNFLLEGATDRGVPVGEYADNLRKLVSATVDAGTRLLLLEPFYLWPDTLDGPAHQRLLAALDGYRAVVADVAAEYDVPRVPLHALFQEQMRHRPPADLAPEPIHPHVTGHLVIAHAVLGAWDW